MIVSVKEIRGKTSKEITEIFIGKLSESEKEKEDGKIQKN